MFPVEGQGACSGQRDAKNVGYSAIAGARFVGGRDGAEEGTRAPRIFPSTRLGGGFVGTREWLGLIIPFHEGRVAGVRTYVRTCARTRP